MSKIVVILSFLCVGVAFVFLFLITDSQLRLVSVKETELLIEKETHIKTLYSEYKNNIDSCRRQAQELKKGDAFIKKNCIDPVNSSILGEWLVEWGRSDLIIKD